MPPVEAGFKNKAYSGRITVAVTTNSIDIITYCIDELLCLMITPRLFF